MTLKTCNKIGCEYNMSMQVQVLALAKHVSRVTLVCPCFSYIESTLFHWQVCYPISLAYVGTWSRKWYWPMLIKFIQCLNYLLVVLWMNTSTIDSMVHSNVCPNIYICINNSSKNILIYYIISKLCLAPFYQYAVLYDNLAIWSLLCGRYVILRVLNLVIYFL